MSNEAEIDVLELMLFGIDGPVGEIEAGFVAPCLDQWLLLLLVWHLLQWAEPARELVEKSSHGAGQGQVQVSNVKVAE